MKRARNRQHKTRGCVLLALVACVLVALAFGGLLACGFLRLPWQGTPTPTLSLPWSLPWLEQRWEETHAATQATSPIEWDEATAPNYYEIVGRADFGDASGPDETEASSAELTPGTVSYAPLDQLGRTGQVMACVDYALMERGRSRERESVQDILPSGWTDNQEVDIELPSGDTYHGYFWNRSHLLAKSLGGDEVAENLICGTRMQNVGANLNGTEGGMSYAETLARDWLEANPYGTILYSATPLYWKDELVCRAVLVDVRSSDGTIDCEVLVYNAAKGFVIDYATGGFSAES